VQLHKPDLCLKSLPLNLYFTQVSRPHSSPRSWRCFENNRSIDISGTMGVLLRKRAGTDNGNWMDSRSAIFVSSSKTSRRCFILCCCCSGARYRDIYGRPELSKLSAAIPDLLQKRGHFSSLVSIRTLPQSAPVLITKPGTRSDPFVLGSHDRRDPQGEPCCMTLYLSVDHPRHGVRGRYPATLPPRFLYPEGS